jgi:hypothetical protein
MRPAAISDQPHQRQPRALLGWALLAACLLCAILLSHTGLARADTSGSEEITFQEGVAADGAALNSQYEAADGVEFDTPTAEGSSLGFPGTLPMTECGATLLTDGYYKTGASPIVILASRSGGDEGCKSSSEFFGPNQGFLFHMDDARASLALQMRAFPQQSNQLSAISGAVAIAYRADGTVLDEVRLDAAEAREWTTVHLSTADPEGIQFVAIYAEIDIGAAVGVQIDNLMLPEALKTSHPAFRVTEALSGQTGDLVEGDTLNIPIQIVRENGSTGSVTVNAVTGEDAAALSRVAVNQNPSEVPAGTARLELTAQRGQAGKSVTIVVGGTGNGESGSQDGPSLTYTFTIEQDLVLVTSTTASVAQSCQDPSALELQVAGTTPMSVEILTSDGFAQEIAVPGRGQYPIADKLSAKYPGGANSEHVSLTGSQIRTNNFLPAFAPATLGVTLEEPTPQLTLTNGALYTTQLESQAFPAAPIEVSLQASGLPCHELVLDVGDDAAPTGAFVPTGTGSAKVNEPIPNGASAPLSSTETVPLAVIDKTAGGATIAGTSIYLDDFRADDGPHFLNAALTSLDWSDMERTFGSDVNDCSPLFCWNDPVAEGYFVWLQNQQPNGLCFGYTMLASDFYRRETPPSLFGAPTVGALPSPTKGVTQVGEFPNYPVIDQGTLFGQELVSGWLSQFDATFQLHGDGVGGYTSIPQFVNALSTDLGRDGIAIIDLRGPQGAGGHSVVAYGVKETTSGQYVISVYNPNVGYGDRDELGSPPAPLAWAGEITSETEHLAGLERSQILLAKSTSTTNEWQLTGPPNWAGPMENLGITTMAERPLKPQLASLNNLGAALQLLVSSGTGGNAPAAAVSQITAAGHPQLGASGMPLKGSAVRLDLPSDGGMSEPAADYVLPAGSTYTVKTETLHRGDFNMLALSGGDGAGVENALATPGSDDSLTVRPGSPTISFSGASGAPATLELIGGKSGAGRETVMLSLGSGAGNTSASLTGAGQLVVHHRGAPTRLSLQLFSGGVAVGSGSIALGRGSTVSLKPHWSSLAGSVSASIGGRHLKLALSAKRGGALTRLLGVKPRKGKKPKRRKRR